VQVAGADVAGQSLIRQAEPQILQLVVEGAVPQVRVLSPPQTGVLASKRASDRTGLCARMSLRAWLYRTGPPLADDVEYFGHWRTCGRAEPCRDNTN
jgi:hypothetical protein